MFKLKILTDTGSDISLAETENLPLQILPIYVRHDDYDFRPGFDMSKDELLELLENSDTPFISSQIPVLEYLKAYDEAYKDGYTHIINITLPAAGSGSYNCAVQARNLFYEENGSVMHIEVVDSMAYSYVYGDGVLGTAKLAAEGCDFEKCLNWLNDYLYSAEALASTYNLKYARISGRISGTKAFIGETLGLKPILHVIDSQVKNIDKVRGEKAINAKIIEKTKERIIEPENQEITIIHGSLPIQDVENLKEMALKQLGVKNVVLKKFGGLIAMNLGPKSLALRFKGKDRRKS